MCILLFRVHTYKYEFLNVSISMSFSVIQLFILSVICSGFLCVWVLIRASAYIWSVQGVYILYICLYMNYSRWVSTPDVFSSAIQLTCSEHLIRSGIEGMCIIRGHADWEQNGAYTSVCKCSTRQSMGWDGEQGIPVQDNGFSQLRQIDYLSVVHHYILFSDLG